MLTLRSAAARGLVALPLLAGVVAVQPALAANHTAARTATVMEKPGKATAGYVFAPATLTVHVGDTVMWKDVNSTPHNVVGQGSASKVISKTAIDTKSYKVTFKKKGTYNYLCQIHPGMVGKIVVK